MFCKNCGSKLNDNAKFCTKCGAQVDIAKPVQPVEAAQQSTGNASTNVQKSGNKGLVVGIIIGVAILLVGIAAALIIFFSSRKNQNPGPVQEPQNAAAPTDEPKIEEPTEEPAPEEKVDVEDEASKQDTVNEKLSMKQARKIVKELKKTSLVKTADEKGLKKLCNLFIWNFGNSIETEMLSRKIKDGTLFLFSASDKYCDASLGDSRYKKSVLLDFWKNLFNFSGELPENWVDEGDDVVKYESFAEGENENSYDFNKINIFENNDYYLVAGNIVSTDMRDQKYAEVLVRKNEWDYPGTIVYYSMKPTAKPIKSIKASSRLHDSTGTYYEKYMLDGKLKTVWAEGKSGTGKGTKITIRLKKKQKVFGVSFLNGHRGNYDLYMRNGKITKAKIQANGKTSGAVDVYVPGFDKSNSKKMLKIFRSYVGFKKPVVTDKIVLTILDADKGIKNPDRKKAKVYADTCITELMVY